MGETQESSPSLYFTSSHILLAITSHMDSAGCRAFWEM